MTNDKKEQEAYKKADSLREFARKTRMEYEEDGADLTEQAADTIESLIRDRNALRQTLTKIVEHGVDSASELRSIAREMLEDMKGGNQQC